MFKSYFIIAVNNLLKNKLYSAINIIGLAVGLAACLLIAVYVQSEASYDTQWEDADRIFRVNFAAEMPGNGLTQFTEIPLVAMPALQNYFRDEIEASTRIIWGSGEINNGVSDFNAVLYQVDPGFAGVFDLQEVSGSLAATLADPGNIALSVETANRFFGNEYPIGKLLRFDANGIEREFQVTAVYRVPGKTIMELPMFARLNEDEIPADWFRWISLICDSYFKLRPEVDIELLNAQIATFTDAMVDVSAFFPDPNLVTSEVAIYSFQNMQDIYLNSPWDIYRDLGNKSQVYAFSAIAVLVLLIGCINFTILSTTKATQRAKEVAMRKVLGADKKQLMVQFLGESFVLVFIALLCSLAIAEIFMPVFQSFVGKTLAFSYFSTSTLLALLVLFVTVGLLGGFYPAVVLSGYFPSVTLKANRSADTLHSKRLRNLLVVFQFSIAISLIVATAVIYLQTEYSSRRDPGFNQDNLLVISDIDTRRVPFERVEVLKQEILALQDVSNVGFSTWRPSQRSQGFGSYDLLGQGAANYSIARTGVGYDFFATYEIPLLSGRDYNESLDLVDPIFSLDPDNPASEAHEPRNIIINRSAVNALGLGSPEQAIGRVFRSVSPEDGARDYTIIGVVEDSHFYSLNALPRAEVYHLTPNRPMVASIRYTGSPQQVINNIRAVWDVVMVDENLSLAFADQLLADEFAQQKTEASMLFSFSLLAIIIACLGLYGLASFTIEKRTKEIGIRKVVGAEVREIIALLLWQFSRPVLLANIVAWPVAMWVMLRWLQRFPYQIDTLVLMPLCMLSGALALCIAWITVASSTYKVASTKPVLALRYE